ncbi:MAG: DegT/DnrJ/EryC1/StrS family aminotransferase [Patescibacteria group bacterium]
MINWFVDFKKELLEIGSEVNASIKRVLDRGWFVLGPEVTSFEKEFAKYSSSQFAVSCGNGTDAIALALKSLDLPAGSQVLTTPFTATYTSLAINMAGLVPVFSDIDETYNIDVNLKFNPPIGGQSSKINRFVSHEIKAVVPVHLYGNPCDMDPIVNYCKETGAVLVEDCAQAHGAKYRGKTVGTFGELGCYSFYPTKNLGAYGDGGAVVTNDANLDKKLRMLREGGQSAKYQHDILGVNSRLDEMQAAILQVKLKFLKKWTERRQQIAKYYLENLTGVGDLKFPKVLEGSEPVYHLFVLATSKRDELAKFLAEKEIKTAIHYPIPLHLQKCYSYLGYKEGDFPNAEKACREVLTIPLHPYLTDEEASEVVKTIKGFFRT